MLASMFLWPTIILILTAASKVPLDQALRVGIAIAT
jgi:hypothetical protein